MDVQLDAYARLGQLLDIRDAFIAENVEITDVQVGRRQAAELGQPGRGSGCRHVVGAEGFTESRAPGREIVIMGSGEERLEGRIAVGLTVIEHRIDEDLLG